MWWTNLSRLVVLLNLAYTARSLQQQHGQEFKQVNSSRIYNSREAARLLDMDRKEVVGLLKSDNLKGRLINGNYRITGKSIEDYLHNEI
jgi:hypothetical protein